MTIKKLKKPRKISLNKSRSINRKNRKSKYKRKSKRIIKKSKKRSKRIIKKSNKRSKKRSKKISVMVGGADSDSDFDDDDFLDEFLENTGPVLPISKDTLMKLDESFAQGEKEEEQEKEAKLQERVELWEFYQGITASEGVGLNHEKKYDLLDVDDNVIAKNTTPFLFMEGIGKSEFLDLNNVDVADRLSNIKVRFEKGLYKQV